jgi:DNA-binding PadR family transcriptional regulator
MARAFVMTGRDARTLAGGTPTSADPQQAGAGAELGTAAYAVLALVERIGCATPYELKALAARLGVADVWPLGHTQVYTCCRLLAAAGLLDDRVERTGRHRCFYSITPQGRVLLARWRDAPASARAVTHDPGLVQLCCGVPVFELALARACVHRRAVLELERSRAALPTDIESGIVLMRDAVLARERFWLTFWEEQGRDASSDEAISSQHDHEGKAT